MWAWRFAVFARTSRAALVTEDQTLIEDLAAPYARVFAPLQRAGQAGLLDRAFGAECLGHVEIGGGVGEPEVRVVMLAWQIDRYPPFGMSPLPAVSPDPFVGAEVDETRGQQLFRTDHSGEGRGSFG